MARLLTIETSTNVCSAALLEDGSLSADMTLHRPRVHAEELTGMIEHILTGSGCTYSALDAVAVSSGPGSYTGLRIGVSTAKGLAFAHDLPLIAVPSLEAVAAEGTLCASPGDWIAAARSARSSELFISIFQVDPRADHWAGLSTVQMPRVTTPEELSRDLSDVELPEQTKLWILGDARDAVAQAAGDRARTFCSGRPSPTAFWAGRCAVHRFEDQSFEDVATFEPDYLRPFHTHRRAPIFDRLSPDS